MSSKPTVPTPSSQKILRGLSFLSLGYLAISLYGLSQIPSLPRAGIVINPLMVLTAISFASLFMYTAVMQLFGQRRKLVIIASLVAVLGHVLHMTIMKFVDSKLQAWAAKSEIPGFVVPDPIFTFEMYIAVSIPWYLAIIFPLITNFRKLPGQEPLAA